MAEMTVLFEAIAFATRAHKHQLRKDGQTPYVSHTLRVAFIVSEIFGIHDPEVLAAAVLHDTVEDTATDYDDLSERFGTIVADWVIALTKDTRLPDHEREPAYVRQLIAAPWQVCVCKCADICDNLNDAAHLSPAGQSKTAARVRHYLDGFRVRVPPEAAAAFRIAEARLSLFEKSLTK